MVENWRSSGVATDAAIVSGLAPGSVALTWMVGKSTAGRSETGSFWYAASPKATKLAMTSVVMTGRRMKGADRFIARRPSRASSRPRGPRPARRDGA